MTTSTEAVRRHRHLGALARHAGRGVDVVGDADAAQLAARRRVGAARRKAVPIGELERLVHDLVIVAAVVDHAERVGVGQLGCDSSRLRRRSSMRSKPHWRAARSISRSMTNITSGRPDAAIGARRRRVGDDAAGAEMRRRHAVDARHDLDALLHHGEVAGERADIADVGATHRQEVAVRVERKLGIAGEVASLVVADEGLAGARRSISPGGRRGAPPRRPARTPDRSRRACRNCRRRRA